MLADRNGGGAGAVAKQIEAAGGRAAARQVDVTDAHAMENSWTQRSRR